MAVKEFIPGKLYRREVGLSVTLFATIHNRWYLEDIVCRCKDTTILMCIQIVEDVDDHGRCMIKWACGDGIGYVWSYLNAFEAVGDSK